MKSISKKTFAKSVLKSKKKVVVFFTGKQCPPCTTMEQRVERTAKVYKDKKYITFYKVTMQGNESLFSKLDIMTIPHLIFFFNGDRVQELSGLKRTDVVKNFVKRNIVRLKNLRDH